MSDIYSNMPSFFSDDPRTGALSYEQLQRRRALALALASRQRKYPSTIGEGLTFLGEAIGDVQQEKKLDAAEAAYKTREQAAGRGLPPETTPWAAPQTAPVTPAEPAPSTPVPPSNLQTPPTQRQAAPAPLAQAPTDTEAPQMPLEEVKARIARNETGGKKDPYTAVGPVSRRGDYPYGKYQVMGERIAEWSPKFLGRKMTPQEFLNDPDAQEQIASGQLQEYVDKYGTQRAANAWFAGPGGMDNPTRRDSLGTAVSEYNRRFNLPLDGRTPIAQTMAAMPQRSPDEEDRVLSDVTGFGAAAKPLAKLASLSDPMGNLGGMPTATDARRDAIAGALAGQQQQAAVSPVTPTAGPAPAVPQQQIAQAPTSATPFRRPINPDVPVLGPQDPEPPPPKRNDFGPTERELRARANSVGDYDPRFQAAQKMEADRLQAIRDNAYNEQLEIWKLKKQRWIADEAKRTEFRLQQAKDPSLHEINEGQGKMVWDQNAGMFRPAPVSGMPTDGPPTVKMTEAQSKDLGYYTRAAEALRGIGDKDNTALQNKTDDAAFRTLPVGASNYIISDEYKSAINKYRSFLLSVLRRDSGGAITKDEWTYYTPIYVPQPGDSQQTLDEKAARRRSFTEGLYNGLGTARPVADYSVKQDIKREQEEAERKQQQQQQNYPTPSEKHIETLRARPETADKFDKHYGPGAAKRILGK